MHPMKKDNRVKRSYRQKVKCPKCCHIFKTRTRADLVCCSYCATLFKRLENITEEKAGTVKRRIYRQRVKCPACSYVFKTRTRAPMVTCSVCRRKFKRKENIIIRRADKNLNQI